MSIMTEQEAKTILDKVCKMSKADECTAQLTGSVDGNVRYDGGAVAFVGRVLANGNVKVTVLAGSSRADGAGRLSRTFGQGKWQGTSGSALCSGYWEAERR